MTTTKLEISSRRLFEAVHDVHRHLPAPARARLGNVALILITDQQEHPAIKCGAWGVCERRDEGQVIYLNPALARQPDDFIANTIAHEIAHAIQGPWLTTGFNEHVADTAADAWGFGEGPAIKTNWKQTR